MEVFTSVLPYTDTFQNAEHNDNDHIRYQGLKRAVLVAGNIPPRDEQFTYIMEMGRAQTVALFQRGDRPTISTGGKPLYLVFPELYLSQHERRQLFMAMARADRDFDEVWCITSDPLIVAQASALWTMFSDDYYKDRQTGWWWED